MGFFDFFKKKEKVEVQNVQNIRFSDLGNWIAQIKKEELSKLNSQISDIAKEFDLEKIKLSQSLMVLEAAEIKNPNVIQRAKHVMEGNRKTYLEKIHSFIDKQVFPSDPDQLSNFIFSFDSHLSSLDKSVAKSHTILVEFFNEKATAVQISIRNLDKIIKDSKKIIENSKILQINNLDQKLNDFSKRLEDNSQEKDLFAKAESEIDSFSKSILKKEFELDKIKENQEYKSLTSKTSQKEETQKKLEIANAKIRSLFSEIEPALKKYENLSKNQMLAKYLENPISALSEDEQLEIFQIIEATRKSMIMNQIVLNDKKRNRVFNEISSISREKLEGLARDKKDFANQISSIESEMKGAVLLNQARDLEKAISSEKSEFERQKKNFEKAKSKFKDINLGEIKNSLQAEIKEKLGKELLIII